MAKIIVTGANGQLGNELRALESRFPQHQFYFCTRTEIDLANANSIKAAIENIAPDFCINCAAYTAVDKAETDTATVFAINAAGVQALAAACAASGARFLHISTDYVFNGTGTEPYTEDHPTDAVNAYGRSKLQGEKEAIAANPNAIIIRTSWVYAAHGANFVKTMIRLMQSRPEVGVVADQSGCPTYAADLAEAIMQIVNAGQWHPGIYHYSNAGIITWFQFAQAIKEMIGANCTVNALTTEQYPTPAKRPHYSVMDLTKITRTYGIVPKPWKESLKTCLQKLGALA